MATQRSEAELKQQGAIEAAADPNSSVTAQDAEDKLVNEAKKGGATALQFDPNASPEEKAAQARARIPEGVQKEHNPKATALVSDVDDGSAKKYDLPPATKSGAITPDNAPTDNANGKTKEEEDEWSRVGWAPRFGALKNDDDDGTTLLDHQTWLEGKIDDKFFGDWYHNAGIMVFACLTCWVVGILGGGLGWIFIVGAFCTTYYRTSLRRVRRNFRDDVNRELAKTKLETDHESLEWINSFLVKFWPIYQPILCNTIVQSVDQVLSTATPAFLDSLRLKTFTLGTKPPRMEHVKTYPKAEDDIVLMDWKFSFTPNDVADLTAKQIKTKINPKVVLEVRIGKGMVSKGLDVIVEDMAFSGLMRVKMKLQLPFPHIERIEICFLERPTIDYVCKPLGGDTFGFDINFLPGLESFIMEQVHANLGPMMYDPNVFPIEVAKMLAGNPVDQAIGVVQIQFHGAQGLKNPDKFSGTPDPYAVVSINDRDPLGRTKTAHENTNPRWNETVNIIVTSLRDQLTIGTYDYNEYRKDKELGKANFDLEQLETQPEHENLQLEVLANGRPRGIVQCDIRFFPVLEGRKLEGGVEEPPPESLTGIVKFTVERAKELDHSKSMIGQLNPYAVLLLNGKEVQISKKLKRTNDPIWPDATKEMLITDRRKAKLGLVIKDDRDIAVDPIVGNYQIKLDDMLDLQAKGHEWYSLAGVKTGRAKMMIQWKPVQMTGALGGSGGYVTPIGVMRLHFINARDLRNVETMGKSDPYVRVLLSGIEKGRTVTFKNNLNPDWDEVLYVPVHSAREKLVLEVMDQENVGRDRSLGHIELPCADFLRQNSEGEYEAQENKDPIAGALRSGARGVVKGTLNYTASFYPTEPIIDPDEEDRESLRGSTDESRPSLDGTTNRASTDSIRKSIEPARERGSLSRSGTITSLRKAGDANGEVDLAKKLAEGEREQTELEDKPKKVVPKLRIDAENIGQYESGLVVFKLIDADLSEADCYVEIVMDDMAFASYSSSKVRSKKHTFNETGDAMVRELDFSKITLRLIEEVDRKGEGKESHIIAKLTGNTIDVLRRALYAPTLFTLKDEHGKGSKITVSLKYIPVKMQLDPSESFNNSGTLRVDVLDAADLPAADRNGYSDPYCKFNLNGKEIFKTKTQKKTLHPAWNEFFEVQVRSRTAAQFDVVVYDWDFGDKADLLGKAAINLDILEPFQAQEVTLGLDGKSGAVRLKMLFKPDYVTRTRQGSSTFHGTFAAPGKVIGAPVKGVGKGAVFVGGGVVKGATFLGRTFRGKKKGENDTDADSINGSANPKISVDDQDPDSPPGSANPQAVTPTNHHRHRSMGAQSISSQMGVSPGGAETGIASFTIVSASEYPSGSNVRVHVEMKTGKGDKEVHKTKAIKSRSGDPVTWPDSSETFKVQCAADTAFKITVKDHSTFGSDDELGSVPFFIDDSGSGGGERSMQVGEGHVVVRSQFVPSADRDGAARELTPHSPGKLRRSILGTSRGRERSVTPS
ncbi:tricalbin [Pseudovirgaria hyperparasitica]|uniref:Tricalbin n=1 Tax=Pseudovirgaria hyperparasitica TaxID=470096 RepID=A0A6A6W400_9PEZI|nr:tricalbin [Pseudovirgaria hyperparasitica]KAF2756287.1 tricalbin [Pseudovirgaria hyperparasitica]